MNELVLTPRQRTRSMVALIAALAVMSVTSSLTWPLLAEIMARQGVDRFLIGISAGAQFVGIIVVGLTATSIIPRLGFFVTMMSGLALIATALVLLPATRDIWIWIPLRLVLGIGNALLFMSGDNWVNQIVEDRVRGRWVSMYTCFGMTGWAIGPILGAQLDPDGWTPFLIALALIVVAAVAMLPTRNIDLSFAEEEKGAPVGLMLMVLLASPTVMLSSLMFGVVEGAVNNFGHLYGLSILGETARGAAWALIFVPSAGAVIWQPLIGWLADHMHRGWLLVGCALAMMTVAAILPHVVEGALAPWWSLEGLALWLPLVVFGGAMGGMFTAGLTLMGERFAGVQLVAANAVFTVNFGLGGVVGPVAVGQATETWGLGAYPYAILVVVSAYALFAAWRQATVRAGPLAGHDASE